MKNMLEIVGMVSRVKCSFHYRRMESAGIQATNYLDAKDSVQFQSHCLHRKQYTLTHVGLATIQQTIFIGRNIGRCKVYEGPQTRAVYLGGLYGRRGLYVKLEVTSDSLLSFQHAKVFVDASMAPYAVIIPRPLRSKMTPAQHQSTIIQHKPASRRPKQPAKNSQKRRKPTPAKPHWLRSSS